MSRPDPIGLAGRTIVVTGASSGIGRSTAVLASERGARIVAVGRSADALRATRDLLSGEGHEQLVLDVTSTDALLPAFLDIVDRGGPLDGLVHAAGIHAATPLRTLTAAQTARIFDVNVTSALMLCKAFRHRKVRGPDPGIVLLSSAVGLVGEAGVSVYAASKAAVASLAQSLALELAREDIRVNSVAAGIVETPLTDRLRATVGDERWRRIGEAHPLGIGTADDVAQAAAFLVSPAARWITGTSLVVDGGYTAQ